MYSLVQFIEDGIRYVCHTRDVKKIGDKISVRWLDNHFYLANMLLTHQTVKLLRSFQKNMECGLPRVLIQSLEFVPVSETMNIQGNTCEENVPDVEEHLSSFHHFPHNEDTNEFASLAIAANSYGSPKTSSDFETVDIQECNICEKVVPDLEKHLSSFHHFRTLSLGTLNNNNNEKDSNETASLFNAANSYGNSKTSSDYETVNIQKCHICKTIVPDLNEHFSSFHHFRTSPLGTLNNNNNNNEIDSNETASLTNAANSYGNSKTSNSYETVNIQESNIFNKTVPDFEERFSPFHHFRTSPLGTLNNNNEKDNNETASLTNAANSYGNPKTSRSTYSLLEKVSSYSPPKNDSEIITRIPCSKSETKKYFCIYCHKLFSKLPSHLENAHSEEDEVRKFLILPKNCEERKQIISIIRKKGCFEFNTDKKYNDGHLIVSRRPKSSSKKTAEDYKPCPSCKGLFSKNTIRKHFPKCVPDWEKGNRLFYILGKRVYGKVHEKACKVLREMIFPSMREDEVIKIIRYDSLIISYGNNLCRKYRLEHLHKMIRSKLRLLGRFLLEIKKLDATITDFSSCFAPEKFEKVLDAINNVAGLNELDQAYKAPATAFELGSLMKKCGKHLIILCISKRDEINKKNAEDFLKVIEEELNCCINKTVMENQLHHQRQKKVVIPSNQEVASFYEFLDINRQKLYRQLKISYDFFTWKELSSFTLTSIQTFNRRRAGEMERILLDDFEKYQSSGGNDEAGLFENLPEEYRKNANNYIRFVIRGKRARGVPVLLSVEIFNCIKLMLKYRKQAGVPKENPYLFGIPSNSKYNLHMDACALMRRFSEESGVRNPNLFRGTILRKHIATKTGTMDVPQAEVSDLANFMGHHDKIHLNNYRIPVVSREIGRISQYLEAGVGQRSIESFEAPIKSSTVTSDFTCHQEQDVSNDQDKTHSDPSWTPPRTPIPQDSWNESSSFTLYGKTRCVSPYGNVGRRSWNNSEKSAATEIFSEQIKLKTIPSLSECAIVIKSTKELGSRTPTQLKAWVANQIQKDTTSTKNREKLRVYWTSEEKNVMRENFKKNLRDGILPGLKLCEEVKQQFPVLNRRTAVTMKAWINNEMKKMKRTKS